MLNIALFGPPGAGKGTQSEFLIKKYNLFYISTGDILRKELAEGSKLGLEAKNIIAEGGLVSDEIIVQIIEKTIKSNTESSGFLFDGFPRTYIQAYILEGLMIKLNTALDCLISIEVKEEESVKRLLLRAETSGRSDDNEKVIRNRLREYEEKTIPVLNFYKQKGNYIRVNGMHPIPKVTEDIERVIDDRLSKKLFNIVMFGYPGSGRGSIGKALAEKYGLVYVSTGEILDDEVIKGTEIGKKIRALYENGQLVTDDIVIPIIERKIDLYNGAKGFIFKGFPRTLVQSYILEGLLKKHDSYIAKIFDIHVDTLELISRLDKRSKSIKKKPYDESTEKIIKRLQEHQAKTIPVIEKYKESHEVIEIDGMPTFEVVFKDVCQKIEKSFKNL
jgi:adenylate kinase